MSSKEVKTALKAAREAIRNKEFKEALRQCKIVLAEDRNNYNALVFVGVAAEGLEQYDQALKAYHRATEACPDQLLAWQGLSTMHTKNPGQVPREDMVTVYEKLIELYQNDRDKQDDAMRKLLPLYGDVDLDKALSLYEQLQKRKGNCEHDLALHLVSRLRQRSPLSPQHEGQLLSCLRMLLSSPDVAMGNQVWDREGHIRIYLQLLQKRELEDLYEECRRLATCFPTCLFPQETQLHLLLDRQMDRTNEEEVEEIRALTSRLTEISEGESSAVLLLAQGYLSLLEGKYTAAREALQDGVNKNCTYLCGQFYLAQVLFKLRTWATCLSVCQQALSLQSSKNGVVSVSTIGATQKLHQMAVTCCLQQGTKPLLTQALALLDQLTETNEETDISRAYVCLELGDQDQLETCMERLKSKETPAVRALRSWIDFHQQRYAEAVSKLEQCVKEDSTNADYLLKLGRALWEQRWNDAATQEQCFNALLKAAKLDPYLSDTFLYLGHFYRELKKDQQRAKKCYQKAYDLDRSNEEAGAALCDLMATLGEEESVQNLLQKATDSAVPGSGKWAWLRLGLAQMRTGDPSIAAASFQSALRADHTDRHVWECLAEAYLHRGSFTAALKAFARAVELCPDSIYSLYQMASIKQRLGALSEAVDEYRLILDKSPDYVPALKGLGETYLLVTQRYLAQGLLGLAVDTSTKAISCLTRSATHRPDLSCLWKLMGDCCTVLHPLHSASFRMEVPRRLCQTSDVDNTDCVVISKLDLMELATKCYGRALKIVVDSAPLWHDFGMSLYYLCHEQSDHSARQSTIEKCVRALKKAVTLDPNHYRHWTALGVVAASPYVNDKALAQHGFIKSGQCEANNAVAWTNLGTLYLRNNNIQLAHEAFKVAQSQEPEYMASWIGQALVADLVGHEEAMDLFRHTTQLGIHTESCIGYGHWVLSTLLDVDRQDTDTFQYCIKQMAAIPAAVDALTRYTEVKKDDACAFNMLGLLLEHQKLHKSALAAFDRAAELAEKMGLAEDQQVKIRLNLARLLSQNQRYLEAVAVYKKYGQTCGDTCQWALALYKASHLQDSCQVYQQALTLAQTDSEKSAICAALGMVAYKAGDHQQAKTALFEGFQLSTPSLQGLLALCALGMLQGDITLTQATLQELCGLVKDGDRLCDVAALNTAFKLSQGQGSEAMNAVRDMLKDRGDTCGLHLLMARLALTTHAGYTALASAKMALNTATTTHKDTLLYLAMSQVCVGEHSQRKVSDNAVSTAQKAFHTRPDDPAALCCLISALHGKALIHFIVNGNTTLMEQELGLLDLALTLTKVTDRQRSWCLKQKAVTQLMMNRSSACLQTLKQLLSQFPQESDLASVLQCVATGDQKGLEPLVICDGAPLFFWQTLLVGLVKERRWREASVLLREAIHKAVSHSGQVVKIVCLVTIAWLAAQQLLVDSVSSESEGALGELEEASDAVGELSDQPYTLIQVLMALVHYSDNPRKAKHHFANTLEVGHVSSYLGVDLSLARRGTLSFLCQSHKDPELVQKLLSEAEANGDMATTELYHKLCMT